ncbi:hypothetical protein HK101_009183 [Irineochytrium annulatum]|nr:hypothetical protein HK101_009183 [Irineochytrium annulatum]
MNRVDRQLPESPVGLVLAYDEVARQVTLGPPDEQQSLWSLDEHYRHTRTTIFRAFAATGEHPDRCMYAIARFAFNPDNPRPIGGKRYPGYQKFKGVTPRDVLDWLLTVSLRPEWEVGRRRPPHPSTLITAVAAAVDDVLKLLNRREADVGGGGVSRGRRGGGDKDETMDDAVLVGMKKAGHVARDQTYLPSHMVDDRAGGSRKATAARDDIAKLWDGLINDPSGVPVAESLVRTQPTALLQNIFAGPSQPREHRLSQVPVSTAGLTGGARHGSGAIGTGSRHPLASPRGFHHSHSSLDIPTPDLGSDGSTLHYVFYIEAPGNPLYGSGVLATPSPSAAAESAGTRRKLGPSRILAEMIEMRDRSVVSLSIAVAARYVLLSPEGPASASSAPHDWLNWWRVADPPPALDAGGHATGSGSGSGFGSAASAASGSQQQPGAAFFTWQAIDDGPRAPWVATSLLLQECDAITRKWLQARLEVELLKLRMCEDMLGDGVGVDEPGEEQEEMKRSDGDDVGEVP